MTDNRTDIQNPNAKGLSHKEPSAQKTDSENVNNKNTNATTTTVASNTVETKGTKQQNQITEKPSPHEHLVDTNITSQSISEDKSIGTNDKSSHNNHNAKRDLPPIDKAENSMLSKNESSNKQKVVSKAPEPQVKKLDIVIAGATYAIYCPADEEAELRSAESYLNTFASNIKKEAPNLNQENLLVLSCLNLYEQINANKVADVEQQQQQQQNEHLLNKIIQEAQSVL